MFPYKIFRNTYSVEHMLELVFLYDEWYIQNITFILIFYLQHNEKQIDVNKILHFALVYWD